MPISPRRTLARSLSVAFVNLLAVSAASAQPATPEPVSPPGETAAPVEPDPDKKRNKAKDGDAGEASGAVVETTGARVELRGRVMAISRYEYQQVPGAGGAPDYQNRLNLELDSARFGLKVEVLDWLSAQLEAELAGTRARIRDGFVQAKRKRWALRAGQFKIPFSVFTLESPWNLPLARRGWLHELLTDHLLLSGRRQGFQAQIIGGGSLDPTLTVAAFRPVAWGTTAGDPLINPAPEQQTVMGRLSVTPAGIELAAVGQRRVTFTDRRRGFWAAGLESTGDLEFEQTGLRFWAEAHAGSSWLAYDPANIAANLRFLSGRALGAFRFGGLARGDLFLEPFASFGLLEPDADSIEDLYLEAMAGVNMGYWRRARLTLQFELGHAQRNFPTVQYFAAFEREILYRHRAVLLMVGAAF